MNMSNSVSATELSQMGGCELRLVSTWGYTNHGFSEELESTKKARKRGDRLHAESEVILAKVFSTSEDVDRVISVQSETNRLAKPATVLGITVIVVGIIAALGFLSGIAAQT